MSVVSIYYYLKIIKLLMTGRNQEITPHVRNYRRSPLRTNNSIELSMIICVIASTIQGISMNPIIEIAQDTLFELLEFISPRNMLVPILIKKEAILVVLRGNWASLENEQNSEEMREREGIVHQSSLIPTPSQISPL
ncbi:hypothetical protein ACB092_08G119600 [Castanea dentata]